MSAPKSSVPSSAGEAPASRTSSTCFRPASEARTGTTFLRYRDSVVTSTRASPIAMRARIGSGPKAENSVQNTPWAFQVPSAAKYSSGILPVRAKIRSPFFTPRPRSTLAKRLERRDSAAKLKSREAPSLPSQRMAMRPARSPRAWRSTASCAMLRPPPGSPCSSPRAWSQENAAHTAS